MQRSIVFSENEHYHIFSRGVEKRTIFSSHNDWERFLRLLYLCNGVRPIEIRNIDKNDMFSYERGETLVDIGAYCLMTNHFHLLLREKQAGDTSKFMQKLLTAYSMYFNKKYNRTGALFGGKFMATHARTDEHLKHLYAYIHLNPLSIIEPGWKDKKIKNISEAKKYLLEYPYSSYQDYVDTEVGPPYERPPYEKRVILNPSAFPEYFETPVEFRELVESWLNEDEV